MTKKVTILGRGTAGALAAAHMVRYLPDAELEWVYDPNIPTQAVGEGSALQLPWALLNTMNFRHTDLAELDGSLKLGIWKENWGMGMPFMHHFPPPYVSYHFNAKGLQSFIQKRLDGKIKMVEANMTSSDIDADYVIDCSGRPDEYEDFHEAEFIPVNSVHVTQCYWDRPAFQHTLTIARPYGWVFGIPLQNRCSIGYMFNKDINNLTQIKVDLLDIWDQFKLTPSEDTNTFSFNNYYRKRNFTKRVAYNGNASFFLEPLEATSIGMMDDINRNAFEIIKGSKTTLAASETYDRQIRQTEKVIMMHYFARSPFNTEFWDYAEERGVAAMKKAVQELPFIEKLMASREMTRRGQFIPESGEVYGPWPLASFSENIDGLGIREKLEDIIYARYKG